VRLDALGPWLLYCKFFECFVARRHLCREINSCFFRFFTRAISGNDLVNVLSEDYFLLAGMLSSAALGCEGHVDMITFLAGETGHWLHRCKLFVDLANSMLDAVELSWLAASVDRCV
jgi:hypothetical protein